LVSSKTVGFAGALAFIFNAATGPGLPFTPGNFQSPGWLFTVISFAIFSIVSGFSILLIVEAMQSIPGNRHFQGDVEYATLINFYFGPVHHVIGQIMLYGALQSNAIQGIVLSAQVLINLYRGYR
jgi:amino acid permease